MTKSSVVVDCQNDFITGTLACDNAEDAVDKIVDFVNENPDVKVFYTSDWHSEVNGSFKENGGIWPPHCVAGTWGAELSKAFEKINDETKRPNENNTYYKGLDDHVEEYSAFNAKNKAGRVLHEETGDEVVVVGIASEYCVRETALDFNKKINKVVIKKDLLGYVNGEDHVKNIDELDKIISII